jgi:hypothetical protein
LVADALGNVAPSEQQEIEGTALLQQKRDPNRDRSPGVDAQAIWFEGYLVSPRPLPSSIAPHQQCLAVVDEEGGQFWLERTQRNPFVASVGIDLVDKVRGYFQPKPITWINFAIDVNGGVLATEDGIILEFD